MAKFAERPGKVSHSLWHGDQCYVDQFVTSNTRGIKTEIRVNGQKLETATSFKYLSTVVTDEGSKLEILSRVAQMTAALTRLKAFRNDRSISISFKIRLMCSLVTSIFLYACESWTLAAESQRRIRAIEMRIIS